jgi:hypothetical protein
VTETNDQGDGGQQQDGGQGQGDGEAGRIHSIEALSERVDRLADAVARIVPGSRAEAQDRVEARLDRPSSVQEQVRAELERAEQERQRQAADEADKAERQTLRERLAKLEETPPRQPVRRATRLLGWGDGSR